MRQPDPRHWGTLATMGQVTAPVRNPGGRPTKTESIIWNDSRGHWAARVKVAGAWRTVAAAKTKPECQEKLEIWKQKNAK